MHPKSFETFCVTTEQTKRAGIAIKWLYDELNRLIDACSSQLQRNIENILDKMP
jgi:hypothetical protein